MLTNPSPETNSRFPCGTGAATKWSFDFITHSTFGTPGPGLPSVLPVRARFPR